jgi:orotidine-5'-phosphate decarboxylase
MNAPMTGKRRAAARRIIFALDVSTLEEARRLVGLLKDRTGLFKVGMELFTAYGPEAVRAVQAEGGRVFLDLKFHDIPNTVSRAAEEALKLGVEMLNLHGCGGLEMMRETAERCRRWAEKENRPNPILLAVTVLTSLDEGDLKEIGLAGPVAERVVRLAELARQAGLGGVVASPREIESIRRHLGPKWVIVTPGVRPAFVPPGGDDQKRVMTAKEAISAGADYIVVGRPVRLAPDPAAAMDLVLAEVSEAAGSSEGST